jgi:AcrR family transcriptional regulator
MSRTPDPSRKPELLAQILDNLRDKPLSGLSFRTLARALDVSTFTLVYQFGTRAELLSDIVQAITEAERTYDQIPDGEPEDLDTHIEQVLQSFRWHLSDEVHHLQRLEMEAAMIEALEPNNHTFTRTVFSSWIDETTGILLRFGLDQHFAEVESRVLNAMFYGFQYDVLVNNEWELSAEAFEYAVEAYRVRVIERLGLPVDS